MHAAAVFEERPIEGLHHIERLLQGYHDVDDSLAVPKELTRSRGELSRRKIRRTFIVRCTGFELGREGFDLGRIETRDSLCVLPRMPAARVRAACPLAP